MARIYHKISGHWIAHCDASFASEPPIVRNNQTDPAPNYTQFGPVATILELKLKADRRLIGTTWRNRGYNVVQSSDFSGSYDIHQDRHGRYHGMLTIPFKSKRSPLAFTAKIKIFVRDFDEIYFIDGSYLYEEGSRLADWPDAPVAQGVLKRRIYHSSLFDRFRDMFAGREDVEADR